MFHFYVVVAIYKLEFRSNDKNVFEIRTYFLTTECDINQKARLESRTLQRHYSK